MARAASHSQLPRFLVITNVSVTGTQNIRRKLKVKVIKLHNAET